jgi:hypothetical protein
MQEVETIRAVLAQIARRRRINRLSFEAAALGCAGAVTWFIADYLDLAIIGAPPLAATAFLLLTLSWVGLPVVLLLQRAKDGPNTEQRAAAAADRHYALHDELRSALAFAGLPDPGPWERLQVRRAAAKSAQVIPAAVEPLRVPRTAPAAAVLIILVLLSQLSSGDLRRYLASKLGALTPLSAAQAQVLEQAREQIRARLAQQPEQSRLRQLDSALAVLGSSSASLIERRQALEVVRTNLETATDAQRAAIRGGAAATDAARRKDDRTPRDPNSTAEDSDSAGATLDDTLIAALAPALEQIAVAQQAGSSTPHKQAQGSSEPSMKLQSDPDAAVQSLRRTEPSPDTLERNMDELMIALSQGDSLTVNRFGENTGGVRGQTSPETGNANIPGGAMFQQGALGRDEEDLSGATQSSRGGSSAGHASATAPLGSATERLAATLQRVAVKQRAPGGGGEDEWRYAASRHEAAAVEFRAHHQAIAAAREEVLDSVQLPLAMRRSVQQYFEWVNQP